MDKNIEQYKKEFSSLKKKLESEEDKCAKNGTSFEDMIALTDDIRSEMAVLDQKIRMNQDPHMTFGKKWKATIYEIKDFVKRVNDGLLTDNDGYGQYGTEVGISDIKIYPSDILDNRYRNDFTHVYWFVTENDKYLLNID